ncbi:hypothetical protein AURDEDRAFT_180507 [Auricularia subglabra TFB-10046 SS5]|nr:hypothetical protein AURDEDRAFT_180507 [Auricularia subglabra TFB-10046 SS5]
MASTSYIHPNGASAQGSSANGGVAGPSNGHISVYTTAPPSPAAVPQPAAAPVQAAQHVASLASSHNIAIVNHLYQAGFRSGNYSDITLQVPWRQYALHQLIISRSPYLAHVMSTSPSSKTIVIPLEQEPHISAESFDIALSYLYSPASLEAVHPHNARAVLAAACLLGGMDELSNYAYRLCLQSISVDTIMDWLDFLDSLPAADAQNGPDPQTVFGPYAKQLREDVLNFLTVSLPLSLNAFTPGELSPVSPSANAAADSSGQETLLHVYCRLPFDLFKRALESPQFPVYGNHGRFKFAKRAIELRKQRGFTKDNEEETVVLAFGAGDGGGHAVHITRKLKKKPLWKVTK